MGLPVGGLFEVTMDMRWQAQQTQNVFQYEVQNWPLSVTMVQALEGWWNHVKASYRALALASQGDVFISVKGREMNNPSGEYAEFDVPVAEKVGTRPNPAAAELLPPFSAAGIRLVVGTRLTRPGQKRLPFLVENDQTSGILAVAMRTLIVSWCNVISVPMVLGAPAALTDLYPIVTKKDANGIVSAHQYITGYIINNNITTQNSRKFGRGA